MKKKYLKPSMTSARPHGLFSTVLSVAAAGVVVGAVTAAAVKLLGAHDSMDRDPALPLIAN